MEKDKLKSTKSEFMESLAQTKVYFDFFKTVQVIFL
jgi:hypothetical protein